MRLARLEGRKSCPFFLSVAVFSAQDLSRLGTSLKMETGVAGTHRTSTRNRKVNRENADSLQ